LKSFGLRMAMPTHTVTQIGIELVRSESGHPLAGRSQEHDQDLRKLVA
jgi:hypothetical protein